MHAIGCYWFWLVLIQPSSWWQLSMDRFFLLDAFFRWFHPFITAMKGRFQCARRIWIYYNVLLDSMAIKNVVNQYKTIPARLWYCAQTFTNSYNCNKYFNFFLFYCPNCTLQLVHCFRSCLHSWAVGIFSSKLFAPLILIYSQHSII